MSDPLAQPCTCDTDDDSWVGETTVPLCPKHEAMLRNLSWDSLACMVVDLSNAIEQPALNAAPAEGLREAARAYRDATGYAMWGTDNEEFVRVWKRDLVGVADAADALRAALKERERLYRALRAVSKVRHVYCLSDGFYSDRFLCGVFSTLEAAKAAADHEGHEADWREPDYSGTATERRWNCEGKSGPRIFGCGFGIEERVLDDDR
jgi:hypothetical protein